MATFDANSANGTGTGAGFQNAFAVNSTGDNGSGLVTSLNVTQFPSTVAVARPSVADRVAVMWPTVQ